MRPIDADALLKHRRNHGKPYAIDPIDKNIDDQLIELKHVLNAPTLDYAPVVHGEWKYNFAFAGMVLRTAVIKCSECDHIAHRIEGEKFVYCPNCGAWMDGKEDGNDAVHP